MNILMIAPQPFYTERGTPMNVRLLCEVLGQGGHTVDLLVLPTGQDVDLPKVKIIRLPNLLRVRQIPIGFSGTKLVYDLLLVYFALGLALRRKYEVIHGIEEGGFLAVLLGKLLRVKSVYDMDSCLSEQLKSGRDGSGAWLSKGAEYLEKWAIKRCSLALTVCSALTERAITMFPGVRIVQIEDIPMVDFPAEQGNHAEEVDGLCRELGIPGGKVAVYTGNLEGYQGIELLLNSWANLLRQTGDPSLKLLIIGGPWARVASYRKLARRQGIEESIHWLGPRPAGEMKYWLQKGDILVSPRVQGENTPLKIYSYMASGRPIVATRRKTHTQVLSDRHAFLASPEPLSFSKAMAEAFARREVALEKGRRAQEFVTSNFSYEVFRKKLLAAYAALESAGEPVAGAGKVLTTEQIERGQ